MDRLRPIVLKLRALLRRCVVEGELDEELSHHIEMETEANKKRGLSPGEARRQAFIAFGGIERFKEESRDVRGLAWLDDLGRDLRHTWRLLCREPLFTGVTVVTLALGIGANTAIFSVVNAVLLSPVPFSEAERLVLVWETDRNSGTTREPGSWPDFLDYQERSRTLQTLAAFTGTEVTLTSDLQDPIQVSVVAATHDLLPLLGIEPFIGRAFTADEDEPGGRLVALLGERFWRTRFQADPQVLGRSVSLDGRSYTIVGVLPAGADLGVNQVHGRAAYHGAFTGEDRVQIWVPLQADAEEYPRYTHPIFMLGRLARGTSSAAAQQELADIAARLESEFPENAGRGINVEPFEDVVFGPVRPPFFLLLGAVVLVLLVACANVANLLLARGSKRAREVAVRTAMGAGASRLTRQFLAESLVLTISGAAAGVASAHFGLRALVSLAPPDIPRLDEVSVDATVLAFTSIVSATVALLFGLVPTFQGRRLDLQAALKSGAPRGLSGSPERHHFRSALAVAQVSVAVVVVVGAGLLLRSLWRLRHVDPGFNVQGVLKAEYRLPESRYPRDFSSYPHWPRINDFHAELLRNVAALPGVEAVAIAGAHPLDAGFTNSFVIVGRESESAAQPEIRTRQISPGYFETVDLALVAGRAFRDSDNDRATLVALINEAAERRFFSNQKPIGQRIRFWGTTREIVGVVGDEKFRGLGQETPPAVYVPLGQAPAWQASLLVRTSTDPLALVSPIRAQVRTLDPELALYGVEPLARTLTESIAGPRFTAVLLTLFGSLAFALAFIGVQSLLSYTVAQRTPELGMRMALGATSGQVGRLIVKDGLRMTAIGLFLGLAGALAFSRLLENLLFGVTTSDPITLGSVSGCIVAAALIASFIPARRAATVTPMETLRTE